LSRIHLDLGRSLARGLGFGRAKGYRPSGLRADGSRLDGTSLETGVLGNTSNPLEHGLHRPAPRSLSRGDSGRGGPDVRIDAPFPSPLPIARSHGPVRRMVCRDESCPRLCVARRRTLSAHALWLEKRGRGK
jgi:hypothetical protein